MLSFEHKSQPLLPRRLFLIRVARYFLFSCVLIGFSLGIGLLGYHFIDKLGWLDALVNASMILAGMGPVDPMVNDAAKYFASFYAIFSGLVFLSTIAVFLAPIAHRVLHRLHLADDDEPSVKKIKLRK
jgi:hypothetical protein